MTLQTFFFLIVAFINVKAQCTTFEGSITTSASKTLEEFNINLVDLNMDLRFPLFEGFDTYSTINNKVQIATFDLRQDVVKENFDFRKYIFFGSEVSQYFAYKSYCFESQTKAYFIFIRKQDYKSFHDCTKPLQVSQSKILAYLRNLVKIFVEFESNKINAIAFGRFNLGCNSEDVTLPLINDLNILYPSDNEMYLHFYKSRLVKSGLERKIEEIMSPRKVRINKSLSVPNVNHPKKIIALRWNAYPFIDLMQEATSHIMSGYYHLSPQLLIKNPIILLFKECKVLSKEFKDRSRKKLSAQKIKKLLKILKSKDIEETPQYSDNSSASLSRNSGSQSSVWSELPTE